MSITGEKDGVPGAGPQKVGVAVADIMTGLYSCIAIQAALLAREKTGRGQYCDMALLDVQLATLGNQSQNYLATGKAPTRQGNAHVSQHMSHLFQAHRQALGVTRATSRVLNFLSQGDALEHDSLLGRGAIEDALNDLTQQGYVEANAGEYALTASGLEKRCALVARAREFTEQQLAAISDADIAAAKRVMHALLAN